MICLFGTLGNAEEVSETRAIEDQIGTAFETGNCSQISELTKGTPTSGLSTLANAIVGYCEPNLFKGDQRLENASNQAPDDELVAYLLAKRIWQRTPEKSIFYWKRALNIASSPSLRSLIQDHISRSTLEDQEFRGHDFNTHASVMVSAIDDDNPILYPNSENPSSSSFGYRTQEEIHTGNRTDYGSWGIDANLKTLEFIRNHEVDFQGLDLEIPIALHIGRSQNLIFSPLGGYSRQGKLNLESYYGILVKTTTYQGDFRHSVQGAAYEDNLYPSLVASQSGTHFSFNYEWQWTIPTWEFTVSPFVDHVTADADLDQNASGRFQIPYTYTAFGALFAIEHSMGKLSVGLYARLNLRFDQLDSTYPKLGSIGTVTKTRQDQNLDSKLIITVPVNTSFQLIGWYEWIKTWSNLGPSDYEDRNSLDQIAAIGLKYLYSSY